MALDWKDLVDAERLQRLIANETKASSGIGKVCPLSAFHAATELMQRPPTAPAQAFPTKIPSIQGTTPQTPT